MHINKLLDKRSPYLFLIKFLVCFVILYLFFPVYRGITGPGGDFYSAFLDSHFNLIKGLTKFLTASSKAFLELLQYNVKQNDYHSLKIGFSRGVSVNPSCLGWAVMSFWIAFVYANKSNWKHKMGWMVLGIACIMLLNIFRIILILLANHLNWSFLASLDSHLIFNIISYGFIFLLIFWYLGAQKKHEAVESNRRKAEGQLSQL